MKKKNAKKAYLTTACDHDCNGGPPAILREARGSVERGILHVVITSDKYTCGNLFALMSLKVDVPFV